MRKTIRRWLRGLRSGWKALHGRQQGQSLIIIILALTGLLAFVGLGIDLGLVYVERVRVSQAADAATLAAAPELPLESAAHERAKVYLQENGYDYSDATSTRLMIDDEYKSGPSEDAATTTIWIDTKYAQTGLPGQRENTANRVRVRVRQQVFMTFMQFIGFHHFPVEATAEAENVTNSDIVIVYDKSGSMEFDTLCYGCWEPSDDPYPDGDIYPLPWSTSTITSADHCANDCGPGDYEHYDGNYYVNDCNYHDTNRDEYYVVIEAEEYSRTSVEYHRWAYKYYRTFWVVQRNAYNDAEGESSVGAKGRDSRGAYLSHHPYRDAEEMKGSMGVSCTWGDLQNGEKCRRKWGDGTDVPGGPFPAPRADYDFYAPRAGDYYVWIRGQGGGDVGTQYIFWGLDGAPAGEEGGFSKGPRYDGAVSSAWDWLCLGHQSLPEGNRTLNLWAGGAGFDVDRIIITTDDGDPGNTKDFDPNNGRTDRACDPCNPRFAGRPGGHVPIPDENYYRPACDVDMRHDDIYDDEQPIRDALEAAKYFVGLLDPRLDQIGYVPYSTDMVIESELECVRRRGSTGCTPQIITDTVLAALEDTRAAGSTNIAGGIDQGIKVLSTVAPHYGRPGATHIMVLMTDGEANKYPGGCPNDPDLWPNDDEPAKDCVIHYARVARNNAIVIYAITLGPGADQALMAEVADITGGQYYHASRSEDLDEIFAELAQRIFVRLTQ